MKNENLYALPSGIVVTSEIVDRAAFDAAMRLARGSYQENILRGVEAMSGATLRGKAKRYGARYAAIGVAS